MEREKPEIVYFILATRFPTEKAYGVTTEFSARATQNLGHETLIVTPFLDSKLNSSLRIHQVGQRIRRILLSDRFNLGRRQRFVIFKIMYSILARRLENGSKSIFWTRDVLVALIIAIGGKRKVVCEIHRTPKGGNLFLLNFIAKMKNIVLCPISSFLDERFPGKYSRMVIAGMSVQEQDLCDTESIVFREKKIVYLGNPSSSGLPLNFNFLNQVAIELNRSHKDWKLQIIGIGRDQFEKECTEPVSENIDLVGYTGRDIALNLVATASVGLVIYPDDDYFKDSFPIKIMEYASKGLAIVASDTTAHRRILSAKSCEFYECNSVDSLTLVLRGLINDSQHRESLGEIARAWAGTNTYEIRVKKVLDSARILWKSS